MINTLLKCVLIWLLNLFRSCCSKVCVERGFIILSIVFFYNHLMSHWNGNHGSSSNRHVIDLDSSLTYHIYIWKSNRINWINNRGICLIWRHSNFNTWWRHQMETFSALLAFCARNSPVPGEFPAQRPVTRSFEVFFDLRPNKLLCKQSWGWWSETPSSSLWRHRNEFKCRFV